MIKRTAVDKEVQLIDLMKQYVNTSGAIDITKFRLDHKTEYALLPHYFGGVNAAIERGGWVKVNKTRSHNGDEKATLRNQLAYDMIKALRNKNTLKQIGDHYGVSKAAINQLYKALRSEINDGIDETDVSD